MNYTDILIGPAEITGAFSLVPQSQACGFVGNPFGSSFAGLDFALGRRIEARRHFCACSLGLHVWVSWKKERRFPTSPTLPLLRTYPRKVDKSKVPQREFFLDSLCGFGVGGFVENRCWTFWAGRLLPLAVTPPPLPALL